ncbi:hypothetical protein [Hydrogenophaga sp. OTU3427]|uniref:hypothetical protein n=1 Tax=Hydrogenophaga sp. OTU3427 TaxID=3043856 RepID=UPI00313EF554
MNWFEELSLNLDVIFTRIKAREDAAARQRGGDGQPDGSQGVHTGPGMKAAAVQKCAAGEL